MLVCYKIDMQHWPKLSIMNHIVKCCMSFQTDNLCQFLPQDKVHDFSKMNPRELLAKTVAAFGEPDLKEDHDM